MARDGLGRNKIEEQCSVVAFYKVVAQAVKFAK
jgi:hypothetical protein